MMYDGKLVELNENYTMDHDYIVGLHYAVVEAGGFVRFPLGVEGNFLVSVGVQERGNLVAHNTMGAASYMNIVRQRARATPGESTDVAMDASNEAGDSESGTDDANVSTANPPQSNSLPNSLEEWKMEHRSAIERDETRDAARIQYMTLEILHVVRGASA